MSRYNSEFYQPVVHDYANFGTWSERGSKDASTRATDVWKGIMAENKRPKLDETKVDGLRAYIEKRTLEGGAPPES